MKESLEKSSGSLSNEQKVNDCLVVLADMIIESFFNHRKFKARQFEDKEKKDYDENALN